MNALVFLTFAKIKNKLLAFLKKPLKLIVVILFFLVIVMNFSVEHSHTVSTQPVHEFYAIIFAFYLLCFTVEAKKGFHSGGTMFSMADVNLLFISPLKSTLILFYGMLSRFGSSFFMELAFVSQFALLSNFYAITAYDVIISVVGYGLIAFLSQLTAMLVYCFHCGDAVRLKKIKALFYGIYLAFISAFAFRFFADGEFSLSAAAKALDFTALKFFPVAGWVFAAAEGLMLGKSLMAVVGLLPCLAFVALGFYFLAFASDGYYEDVLLSAEKKENQPTDSASISAVRVREKDKSLIKGEGASAFFYKHRLENRRTKSSLLSPSSLFYLAFIAIYGFVLKSDFIVIFSFSCMAAFVPVLSGRWLREVNMPYIFMIPASPIKKLFYILPEMLPKIITESVLQCALIGYIFSFGAVTVAALVVSRISISLVLICCALVVARIFHEKEKNNIFLVMGIIPGIVFLVPSIAVCVAVIDYGFGLVTGFALMSVTNLAVSLVLLFFARNLLKAAE